MSACPHQRHTPFAIAPLKCVWRTGIQGLQLYI